MSQFEVRSNVCLGVQVPFYWIDNASMSEDEHLVEAVDALFAAIQLPGVRLWSPHSAAMVRATFKKRLQKAARGELRPPRELKPVGSGRPTLYEIRWSGISVRERDEDGGPDAYFDVEIRMLHGEPDELGLCFLGLHAHEKQYWGSSDEIKAAQDAEIQVARNRYIVGEARFWGVSKRTAG